MPAQTLLFVNHLCQHMTAGILSLVTESDANYTITASLLIQFVCLGTYRTIKKAGGKSETLVLVRRIHFQRHPGLSGEYHHLSHEGYEPQLFLYPRTQRWSGDLKWIKQHLKLQICECEVNPHLKKNGCWTLEQHANWGQTVYTLTCQFADCIWLAAVLAHVGVNKIHNIRANWSLEHSRHDNILACRFSFLGVNRDQRSGTGLKEAKFKVSFKHMHNVD